VTVQVRLSAETVRHPDQLETSEPDAGVAVSVTVAPFGALPVHAPALPAHETSGSVSSVATVPCPVPEVLAVRRYVVGWNVAVTVLADVIVTVQASLSAETVRHPDQLETSEPDAGVAVSVTVAPFTALPVHAPTLPVQEMSGSVSVVATVPCPVPDVLAVTRYVDGWNVAVTDFAEVIGTVQVSLSAVTVVHPDHPNTSEPAAGDAVSVTVEPFGALPLHAPMLFVQEMSGSVSTVATVPCPVPAVLAVRTYVDGWKVAVTVRAAVIVTVQAVLSADTVVHPVQPDTIEMGEGDAVSVTVAPFGAEPLHAPMLTVQSMSGSVSPVRTTPLPVPAVFAVRRYVDGWNVAVTVLAPVIETVQVRLSGEIVVHPDHA
jgi:hypothetical protein